MQLEYLLKSISQQAMELAFLGPWSPRRLHILRAASQNYVHTGEPVGMSNQLKVMKQISQLSGQQKLILEENKKSACTDS